MAGEKNVEAIMPSCFNPFVFKYQICIVKTGTLFYISCKKDVNNFLDSFNLVGTFYKVLQFIDP